MNKRSTLARVLGAIWTGVNGARKVLHLLLLLFIFSIVIAALSASTPKLPSRAALVIRPAGNLVEQLEGDPYERAIAQMVGEARPETLMQDVIDGLTFAKDDSRIKAVVLYLDQLGSGGLSKLQRLGAALDEFRESSDKPVIAMAGSYSQDAYYIAAHADEVYMHPEGLLFLQGYGVWRNYYKDAIDKLKIDWNVFRVGAYKSAVEPFTRNDMSEEDEAAMTRLVNHLWTEYRNDVEQARELEPGSLDDLVNGFARHVRSDNGDVAQVAVDFGLIDELLTREEVGERVAEHAGSDPESVDYFNAAPLDDYLAQMRATHGEAPAEENVAVIVAAGEILDGEQPPGTVGGDSTAELLRRARQDKTVKAVVLRVDSPGGSAFASEVIRNEILSLKEAGKPVVASMGSVAASGGYWISMAADRIYASSTTITGSIGIFGMFPTFQRSLAYLGISTDGIGTSKWAGQLRSDRELSEDAKELIQVVIDDGYEDFISRVALHRDLKKEEVDRVAQGQVWTGAQALDFGLIDELGNLDAAVAGAAELASLKPDTYGLKYFEKELTPAEQLFLRLIGGARATGLEPGGLFGEPSPVERLAGDLASALSPLLRFNDPNGVYAYCLFCTVH
ncbi:MAG TPA: signal peptide peptidase SppA [Woeseiaceae bacterium]|nr:signal peptide peptidase SppA [Woeseiaceae bacterium]